MKKKLWLITTISLLSLTGGLIVLIGNNFAATIVMTHDARGKNNSLWESKSPDGWDDKFAAVDASISMDILDDDGNSVAYLCVWVGRRHIGKYKNKKGAELKHAVRYMANAHVYARNLERERQCLGTVTGKRCVSG